MKAYTNLEQSKKLAEMLPLESADMHWAKDFDGRWFVDLAEYTSVKIPKYVDKVEEHLLPCWSLAALINLLPSEFTEKGKYSKTTYLICIRKYALTEDVDLYQIAYGNYKFYEDGNSSWKDMINTGEKENLIDAVFQMICWLKENNKL